MAWVCLNIIPPILRLCRSSLCLPPGLSWSFVVLLAKWRNHYYSYTASPHRFHIICLRENQPDFKHNNLKGGLGGSKSTGWNRLNPSPHLVNAAFSLRTTERVSELFRQSSSSNLPLYNASAFFFFCWETAWNKSPGMPPDFWCPFCLQPHSKSSSQITTKNCSAKLST